jgi:hypothetical protein
VTHYRVEVRGKRARLVRVWTPGEKLIAGCTLALLFVTGFLLAVLL